MDSKNLYMILEFLAGGELFSYLRMSKQFPSFMVKFYTAEIVLALEYLHSMYIVSDRSGPDSEVDVSVTHTSTNFSILPKPTRTVVDKKIIRVCLGWEHLTSIFSFERLSKFSSMR